MRQLVFLLAFAAAAAQSIPRAEFPQPQFQRAEWVSLNGPWQFEFDDANKGVDEKWSDGAKPFSKNITVPYCFESKLSGIADTSFHPWVWYRRTVTIPAAWKGKRVHLKFGAVDYRAWVWVNGKLAGSHEGGNVPFGFDITPLLANGPNTIIVRAEDPPLDQSIPRGKQYWEPKSRSIFYTRTSGIWQPVWLEATGASWLDRVRITPSTDGVVRVEARVANADKDTEFTATVRTDETSQEVLSRASAPARNRTLVSAQVPDPRLWSPGSPKLYGITFELKRGGVTLDKVESYFGFRSVSVSGNRVWLNGRPVYLKMILDQGYWPESILTPPSDEAIQYDIRLTKEMGFNGARKHQKLEDPRFLYWADKMGLLVSSEMANAFTFKRDGFVFDDDYTARFTREWMETIERDYNHPSIILWVPINESWGVPDLRDSRQQQHLRSLVNLTKSLDSTRLVIDNDGWEHIETTDLFAVHDYTPTGAELEARWKQFAADQKLPFLNPAYLVEGFKYNGTPLYLSEFGGIAYIPPGTNVPPESWGYSGVEKTPEAAIERLRGIYQSIARLPFAGICYTQLTDVEQEVNGLLTYDRKPKFDPKVIKQMNDMLR